MLKKNEEIDGRYERADYVVGPSVARLAHIGEQMLGVLDVKDGSDANGTELKRGVDIAGQHVGSSSESQWGRHGGGGIRAASRLGKQNLRIP